MKTVLKLFAIIWIGFGVMVAGFALLDAAEVPGRAVPVQEVPQ